MMMINQDDIDDNIENREDNNNPPVYLRSASTLKSSWKAVLQVGFEYKDCFLVKDFGFLNAI